MLESKSSGQRDQWGKGVEFLFSCIALSVGLGNVWRFPFIALEIGGGAFLIPYVILLLLIGRPVYYLELIIGQFLGRGCIKAFDMVAIMKGIAYGQVYSTAMATTYYACIMALTIRYLLASFSEVLSWTYCLVEWGSNCVATGDSNDTSIGRQNNIMSAPVRGNKASKLRSEGKVEKRAPIGPSWVLTSTRGKAFNRGSEPTSRDTSPSRIPTIRRPRSIPTSRIPIRMLAGDPKRNTSPVRATPLEAVTSAIACSLPLLLASENTVGDHEPTESVHDLKERCRAVVDEHEARNQREKIRNKLDFGGKSLKSYITDALGALRPEFEANLADELAACDHTISELKKSLRRSDDVVEELSQLVAEKSATLANEDGIIGELRIELGKLRSVKLRMHHRLEEAHIAFLVGELKEAREHIVNLQQRQDFIDIKN
ncbi:hypothetical protein M5D96_014148 [Drosophila gunungcola]|uniref:Sodium-dependent nutrient amino acid transporter 1 n=1 Tax=Drosophila gunungcola TaxID=103775 RepID=A0A9Q0BIF0_9MUSC|nr:hypothetical protein M5D96_014148 [Drosophila gunungcola]